MNAETFELAARIVDRERTATHEAGHAAAALAQGLAVREISVHADGESAGRAQIERPDNPDGLRKFAVSVITGRMEDGGGFWPPSWPLARAPGTSDERDLTEAVKALGLDRADYSELVQDAFQLATSPQYERLRTAISYALERHGRLDEHAIQRVKAIVEGGEVQHAIKAATVTATEQGEFTAIAAAYTVDRVKDQIIRGAFNATIERWRASGKRVPLHWDHRGEAANVIGSVDPHSMRETAEGLQVSGRLDIDSSDTAREAWRSMKNGTMSLSFGYITTKRRKRSDGINELQELDLFEISIAPQPANPDTRVVAMKSLDVVELADSLKLDQVRREARDQMLSHMSVADDGIDHLRIKSERIAREHAPIQIVSFEC